MNSSTRIILVVLGASAILLAPQVTSANDADSFFENEVRPILVDKCGNCHGNESQSGGLRVISRRSLVLGGDTGAAIIPGNASESLLIRAVRRSGDLAMPPDEPLDDRAIRALQQWIEMGAHWPASDSKPLASPAEVSRDHWAFQPIQRPVLPAVDDVDWVQNPIDSFVRAKLAKERLVPSPMADRRTLIRRVAYSLTGLPPSLEHVERFLSDEDPHAYRRMVQRLLESPEYGEHWARHWLDVARYSDTKGYVYAREERFWTHAWAYRDWVVQSLNDDMPYDRFVLLQLAADQVEDRQQQDLAAMGFLTLGRRFLGVKRDIIDDRIDVVTRGTMGLTVGCARCHDHKYDPIPTADYYSLYGVFDSCVERLVPLADYQFDETFAAELNKRQRSLNETLAARRAESSARARERVADYLFAQSELQKYPADGFDQIFSTEDLLPSLVRRWQRYLREADRRRDPVFTAWHQYARIPQELFTEQTAALTYQLRSAAASEVHPAIADALDPPPQSFREVCDLYGGVFGRVREQWESTVVKAKDVSADAPKRLSDPEAELLRQVLYGPQAPCEVPEGPISELESYFDSSTCTALWKLQGEVDRLIINSEAQIPFALTLSDKARPVEPRIFRRGDPLNQGRDVPRQFLSVLSKGQPERFQRGSGRLELAKAIVHPDNPLTARVIVNRVWKHHFGRGLVATPSDFGTRALPPSHPELLDWLASDFIAEDWSLKKLHRKILLSNTYRQSSMGPGSEQVRALATKVDPENRWLWRANPRRLSFEEFRDTLLVAADQLDRALGGKPATLFKQPYANRRTLYVLVDRQYLPGTLRVFDFANPDMHIPQRSETTVPQRALFFMNHPFVLQQARSLAELSRPGGRFEERVKILFNRLLQRHPSDSEVAEALALIEAAATNPDQGASRLDAWEQLAQVLVWSNELAFVD